MVSFLEDHRSIIALLCLLWFCVSAIWCLLFRLTFLAVCFWVVFLVVVTEKIWHVHVMREIPIGDNTPGCTREYTLVTRVGIGDSSAKVWLGFMFHLKRQMYISGCVGFDVDGQCTDFLVVMENVGYQNHEYHETKKKLETTLNLPTKTFIRFLCWLQLTWLRYWLSQCTGFLVIKSS